MLPEGLEELKEIVEAIDYLNQYLLFYNARHEPVPVQMANASMFLALNSLLEIKSELVTAYHLHDIEQKNIKVNDIYWDYSKMSIEIDNFKTIIQDLTERIFSLYLLRGIRITMIYVHLNQAIQLYKFSYNTI